MTESASGVLLVVTAAIPVVAVRGSCFGRSPSGPAAACDTGAMPTSAAPRRHLPSSPFRPDPVPVIEEYAVGDRVSHDSYGLGQVTQVESGAVTVDFGSQTLRIPSPYAKMSPL